VKALLANDIAAVEELLADELTYVHSNGSLDTKESYLDALRSGATRYLAMEMANLRVRSYGDTAVVTGTMDARVRMGDREVNPKPRALIVYVKRDGRWQMVAWQTTNLPAS
jgi:ketosteroid isomerase-like protein